MTHAGPTQADTHPRSRCHGAALETLLSPRHDIAVWDRDLDRAWKPQPLEEAARDREVVVFAMPAKPHDELAGRLAACLEPGAVCLSIAKGLDERGRTPAQIFDRSLRHAKRLGIDLWPHAGS